MRGVCRRWLPVPRPKLLDCTLFGHQRARSDRFGVTSNRLRNPSNPQTPRPTYLKLNTTHCSLPSWRSSVTGPGARGCSGEWGGRSRPEAPLLLSVAHHHLQPPEHPPQHLVPPQLMELLRTPVPAAPPSCECPAAATPPPSPPSCPSCTLPSPASPARPARGAAG